jgi:hypothetical protein
LHYAKDFVSIGAISNHDQLGKLWNHFGNRWKAIWAFLAAESSDPPNEYSIGGEAKQSPCLVAS